jgi:hypothetical protein
MWNWSQYESKARWKVPAKKRLRKKSEVKLKRVMPNEAYRDKIYLNGLILTRH